MYFLVVIDMDEVNIEVRFQAWRIRSTPARKCPMPLMETIMSVLGFK
jgi:hypothetical protein